MTGSRIPVMVARPFPEKPLGSIVVSRHGELENSLISKLRRPTQIPRFTHAPKVETLQRTTTPTPQGATGNHAIEYGLCTPPWTPVGGPPKEVDAGCLTTAVQQSLSCSGAKDVSGLVTPPDSPLNNEYEENDVPESSEDGSLPSQILLTESPLDKAILARKPKWIERLELFFIPSQYHITDALPPTSQVEVTAPCVQCNTLGLECDMKHPTCSRCARRLTRAQNMAFQMGKTIDNEAFHIGDALEDVVRGAGPCLAIRWINDADRECEALRGKGTCLVLGRTIGEGKNSWEKKITLSRRLVDAVRAKRETQNWALPIPVAKGMADGATMWKNAGEKKPISKLKGHW